MADIARSASRIPLLRFGPGVAARLRAAPSEAGVVHSVFERALNLMWHDGHLLTLQGPGSRAAPFAAAGERLPRGVREESTVWRDSDFIRIGEARLDWREAALVDTALAESRDGPGPALSRLIEMPSGGWSRGLDGPQGQRARRQMSDGLRCRDAARFLDGALGLVGLGEGLTPAGDDCLVGTLAVVHRFARPWLLDHPEIRSTLERAASLGTTTVAREFIAHALAGHFAEDLVDLLTAGSAAAVGEASTRLLRTGATSGADTLVGIRFALSAL